MTDDDVALMDSLIQLANEKSDGHMTIMKFTTNWRVSLGTPSEADGLREDIDQMPVGKSFAEAARKVLTHTYLAET
jgi:hypothetical protein